VIALENNMKTPKSFGKPFGVLNVGMTFIVLLYIAVGAIGYVFCVEKCSDSVTLDLPQDEWSVHSQGITIYGYLNTHKTRKRTPFDHRQL
jgi:hypothetical protein